MGVGRLNVQAIQLPLFDGMMIESPSIYPNAPGFKGERGGPSETAARKVTTHANTIRGRVLAEYQTIASGMTADEMANRLGLSILTVRPRVAELHRQGELEPTPTRHKNVSGMTATVWRVPPKA